MRRVVLLIGFLIEAGALQAQDSGYNISQSWELGHRFAEIGGNEGVYRSDVNYGNGIRLLDSSLSVNSKDGRGKYFDEIILTTLGLGNDPYESAVLRVEKNQLYRYDMTWRLNDYYNPDLTVSQGLHAMDTRYEWQDHDFTLFPQSHFRLHAGYGRNTETGPALTSEELFDDQGDRFPIFQNIRREFNEYRFGGDAEFDKIRITFQGRREYFKEDTGYGSTLPSPDATPGDSTSVSQFVRSEPMHGSTPTWLVNLATDRRWFAINGRFTYSGGSQDFIFDEQALGTNRIGANVDLETLVTGSARRPVVTGDLNASVFATPKLTITDNTSFHNTRMDGNNLFQQYDSVTGSEAVVNFQFLGIRLITNSLDARYRFSNRFTAYGGYQYSDRQVRSIEDGALEGSPLGGIQAEQTNILQAGIVGFNWNPISPLRIQGEAEIGLNNQPYYPIAPRNTQGLSARTSYQVKQVRLSGNYRQYYNNNSIQISAFSSRSRTFSTAGSWAPNEWFSLDGSYSYLHLDTIGGIAYFAGSPAELITGQNSVYLSNIHAANFGFRIVPVKRAELYLGYNVTHDAGDGRAAAGTDFLTAVQTFPLTFQSPVARLSFKLTEKLRWNAAYQYYGYSENFGLFGYYQNYHAHTGYTSLLWSF